MLSNVINPKAPQVIKEIINRKRGSTRHEYVQINIGRAMVALTF